MALETHLFEDPRNRRFFLVAVALGTLALLLAPLHTLSALLSLPFTGAAAYVLCDMASHAVAGRPFVFPSKWGLNTEEERRILAWSDHVLAFVCGALTVVGLFVFGELVDCVRHENVWRGEAVGLDWCVPRAH
jgi:hypothetical protein